MPKSLQVTLVRRPEGRLDSSVFDIETVKIEQPSSGQVLVRNLVFSLDPYMRPRMDDEKSYVAPFPVGAPLEGGAVGEVIASGIPEIDVGAHVLHMAGWREYALLSRKEVRTIAPTAHPLSYQLGVLGMPGLTAYAGLVSVAKLAGGESIYISSAAGTVGGLAGQMAKILGARQVIGSVGSTAKVKYAASELGYDSVIDYRTAPIADSLSNVVDGGIDVYFDNVGGDHFAAALSHMSDFGRVVMCGTISSYDDPAMRTIPGNLFNIVRKRLTVTGLYVNDHVGIADQFTRNVGQWLDDGKLAIREVKTSGVDSAPEAFLGLLRGEHIGKVLVEP
ncbi:NADP-dependent oxidoreductase [Rhodococcus qingshengii]|uniref:NADP-dependent oxidoreductase n=1 Tax=Rhodococcus qingshengii TaxID=334542 RepID=UPI0010A60CAD|nr:NADP-dependent oxidoreductase [Rhodococcus qingshengii]THJ67619.1 NADP-dependent oxidoreductase [Rhodococcus qingshengii]